MARLCHGKLVFVSEFAGKPIVAKSDYCDY